MLINGTSSGESCTKHSNSSHNPCSSGTSSPHFDPTTGYCSQNKQIIPQHAYPQYPQGECKFYKCF